MNLRYPGESATRAEAQRSVRAITSQDAHDSWGTVGVSENIIEASWQVLADSIEYKLLKDQNAPRSRLKDSREVVRSKEILP